MKTEHFIWGGIFLVGLGAGALVQYKFHVVATTAERAALKAAGGK